MVRRDSLATLARLHAIETTQAQADLARAGAARQDAAARAMEAERRVRAESADSVPVTYGTWLSAQLAIRQQLRAVEASAAVREEEARTALVEARRAERSVERLVELRLAEERRLGLRREAAALEDAARRRPLRSR